MSIVVHNFEQPDRFVAGTVGEPGQRTFFLQAREGNRITSVALEKQQVSVLAERVDLLLDEALRRSGGDVDDPGCRAGRDRATRSRSTCRSSRSSASARSRCRGTPTTDASSSSCSPSPTRRW